MSSRKAQQERERASLVDHPEAPALAPVFAAALTVARDGVMARPYVPVPEPLRPYLRTPQPTVRMWAAIREVLDTDDEFRARVRDAVSADEIGPAGWLFLARPQGWSARLAAALDPAFDTDVGPAPLGEPETDDDGADVDDAPSSDPLVGADGGSGPPAQGGPVPSVDPTHLAADIAERVSSLRAELGTLRAARILRADARPDVVPAAVAPVVADVAPPSAGTVPPWLVPLSAASATARQLADQLAVLVASFGPDVVAPGPSPCPTLGDSSRRPVPTPPGIDEGTEPAVQHLLRIVGAVVLVDGAALAAVRQPNVTAVFTPMLAAVGVLADRTGANFEVTLPGAGAAALDFVHPAVRVRFLGPGLGAVEVISLLIRGYPPERPLVVASNDPTVKACARLQGANVTPTEILAAVLDR